VDMTGGVQWGCTGVKIYANLPGDLVARTAQAARKFGLRTWSHAAVFPAKPSDAVRGGV